LPVLGRNLLHLGHDRSVGVSRRQMPLEMPGAGVECSAPARTDT
jgi:hypothetical protein